jgi:hypothetical protein
VEDYETLPAPPGVGERGYVRTVPVGGRRAVPEGAGGRQPDLGVLDEMGAATVQITSMAAAGSWDGRTADGGRRRRGGRSGGRDGQAKAPVKAEAPPKKTRPDRSALGTHHFLDTLRVIRGIRVLRVCCCLPGLSSISSNRAASDLLPLVRQASRSLLLPPMQYRARLGVEALHHLRGAGEGSLQLLMSTRPRSSFCPEFGPGSGASAAPSRISPPPTSER